MADWDLQFKELEAKRKQMQADVKKMQAETEQLEEKMETSFASIDRRLSRLEKSSQQDVITASIQAGLVPDAACIAESQKELDTKMASLLFHSDIQNPPDLQNEVR